MAISIFLRLKGTTKPERFRNPSKSASFVAIDSAITSSPFFNPVNNPVDNLFL